MTLGEEAMKAADATDLPAPARRLSEILLASITALAGAGDPEAACRFAGQACVTLRRTDPAVARRFDALLHRLSPRLNW